MMTTWGCLTHPLFEPSRSKVPRRIVLLLGGLATRCAEDAGLRLHPLIAPISGAGRPPSSTGIISFSHELVSRHRGAAWSSSGGGRRDVRCLAGHRGGPGPS